jgi:hypothetical protein
MTKKENNAVELDKEQKEEVPATPIRKLEKRKISFDVYFSLLMKKRPGIFPHHKAPMRKFAENNGLKEATEEEFDRIFRLY